jgi:hypothetical protein
MLDYNICVFFHWDLIVLPVVLNSILINDVVPTLLELNWRSVDGKACVLIGSLLSLFQSSGFLWFYNVVNWLDDTLARTRTFLFYLEEVQFCVLFTRNVWNKHTVKDIMSVCLFTRMWANLINFMEQSPCWKAISSSATQEISHVLWNLKVHYYFRKSPPLPTVSWMNPDCTLIPYFFKILFNISLPSRPRSAELSCPFRFWLIFFMYLPSLPC